MKVDLRGKFTITHSCGKEAELRTWVDTEYRWDGDEEIPYDINKVMITCESFDETIIPTFES